MNTLMEIEKKNETLVQEKYLRLEIVEKIFEIMDQKGIKQTDLAKKMKISKSQVSRVLADDRNLTLTSVARIFVALDEELAVLTKSEEESLTEQSKKTETVVHLNISYEKMPSAIGTNTIIPAGQSYSYKAISS